MPLYSLEQTISKQLVPTIHFISLFLKDFIYLVLGRGGGREKGTDRNINVSLLLVRPPLETWPTTQACALIGN